MTALFNKIQFGDGLYVTDEGNGVISCRQRRRLRWGRHGRPAWPSGRRQARPALRTDRAAGREGRHRRGGLDRRRREPRAQSPGRRAPIRERRRPAGANRAARRDRRNRAAGAPQTSNYVPTDGQRERAHRGRTGIIRRRPYDVNLYRFASQGLATDGDLRGVAQRDRVEGVAQQVVWRNSRLFARPCSSGAALTREPALVGYVDLKTGRRRDGRGQAHASARAERASRTRLSQAGPRAGSNSGLRDR